MHINHTYEKIVCVYVAICRPHAHHPLDALHHPSIIIGEGGMVVWQSAFMTNCQNLCMWGNTVLNHQISKVILDLTTKFNFSSYKNRRSKPVHRWTHRQKNFRHIWTFLHTYYSNIGFDSRQLPWAFLLPAGLLMLMGWRICGGLVQFGCYQHRYEWGEGSMVL